MLPPVMSKFLPSCLRSLSFAVIATTLAPCLENSARTESERKYSGSFIITSAPVSGSRK